MAFMVVVELTIKKRVTLATENFVDSNEWKKNRKSSLTLATKETSFVNVNLC